MTVIRRAAVAAALASLAACGVPDPSTEAPREMGQVGFLTNAVVVVDPVMGPLSREVDADAFGALLQEEMDARFSAYDGPRKLHMGTSLEGYVVAAPGIPVVLAPKSIIMVRVNVFDDRLGPDGRPVRLNGPKGEVVTAFENLGAGPIVGSGYTLTAEEQMAQLARNAAFEVQRYLLKNPQWLALPEGADEGA